MGKTKVLSNGFGRMARAGHIDIRGEKIEILPPEGSTAYLGRALCLTDIHGIEIRSRMAKAWAKFNSLRDELCNERYPLPHRL
eukprot:12424006-Karenia_brevis.AAC.1